MFSIASIVDIVLMNEGFVVFGGEEGVALGILCTFRSWQKDP